MKNIKDLKEIAQTGSDIKDLNSLEKSIVFYFNNDDSFLKEELSFLEPQDLLSIIYSLLKIEEVKGEINLNTLEYSFIQPELNSLLKNVKINIFLDKEDFNVLLSKNIEILDVSLEIENGVLGLKSIKQNSTLDNMFLKMKEFSKKSAPKLVNSRNNVVMASMMMLGTAFFTSCGSVNDISAKANYQTRPPITMPAIDGQIEGDFELNFANHAVYQNEEDELTSYKMSEPMLITVPKTIQKINFQSSSSKPTLTLTANNQYVCSYVWVSAGQSNPNALDESVASIGEYRMHKSCFQEMEADNGMVIKVENLPKAKTISMKFHFEK